MKRKKGSALMITICLSMAMFSLSAALVLVGTSSNKLANSYNKKQQRQLFAQAGINRGIADVNKKYNALPAGSTSLEIANSLMSGAVGDTFDTADKINNNNVTFASGDTVEHRYDADYLTVTSYVKDIKKPNSTKKIITVLKKSSGAPSLTADNALNLLRPTTSGTVKISGCTNMHNNHGNINTQGKNIIVTDNNSLDTIPGVKFIMRADTVEFGQCVFNMHGPLQVYAKTSISFTNGQDYGFQDGAEEYLKSPIINKVPGANITWNGINPPDTPLLHEINEIPTDAEMNEEVLPTFTSFFSGDESGDFKYYLDPAHPTPVPAKVLHYHIMKPNGLNVDYLNDKLFDGDSDDTIKILVLKPGATLNVTEESGSSGKVTLKNTIFLCDGDFHIHARNNNLADPSRGQVPQNVDLSQDVVYATGIVFSHDGSNPNVTLTDSNPTDPAVGQLLSTYLTSRVSADPYVVDKTFEQ